MDNSCHRQHVGRREDQQRNLMCFWHVPFKGRRHSGATAQNFLWGGNGTYVMDNHRAAMWCWVREMSTTEHVGLLHIDEHYDTLYANIQSELATLPSLSRISIDGYLALTASESDGGHPLIRWDNYLSLFLERYSARVPRAVFITHDVGDKPRHANVQYPKPQSVPENMDYWLRASPDRWIINVDLDYFFCDQGGVRRPMFSEQYVDTVFRAIADCYKSGRVACLTLCLSPDEGYSGSWEQAEILCGRACELLDIPFVLPVEPIS